MNKPNAVGQKIQTVFFKFIQKVFILHTRNYKI